MQKQQNSAVNLKTFKFLNPERLICFHKEKKTYSRLYVQGSSDSCILKKPFPALMSCLVLGPGLGLN